MCVGDEMPPSAGGVAAYSEAWDDDDWGESEGTATCAGIDDCGVRFISWGCCWGIAMGCGWVYALYPG